MRNKQIEINRTTIIPLFIVVMLVLMVVMMLSCLILLGIKLMFIYIKSIDYGDV